MRLAVVGAGRIVNFHLPALRAAGFELAAIAARSNSSSARSIAKEFGIPKVFGTSQELISQIQHFDAILIASSSNSHLEYLSKLSNLTIPTLIEKPVFTNIDLNTTLTDSDLLAKHIMVGYNRRFYPSVKSFKRLIDQRQGGLLSICVPELSGSEKPSAEEIYTCLRQNTVHIFDLLHFLFPLQTFSKNIFVHWNSDSTLALVIVLQDKSFLIDVNITFGSPGNYNFEFRSGSQLATLKPLERLDVFEGMLIEDPTSEKPVRTYTPNPVSKLESSATAFKPGFLEQAKHFFELASKSPTSGHATLQDAFNINLFVNDLIKKINDEL